VSARGFDLPRGSFARSRRRRRRRREDAPVGPAGGFVVRFGRVFVPFSSRKTFATVLSPARRLLVLARATSSVPSSFSVIVVFCRRGRRPCRLRDRQRTTLSGRQRPSRGEQQQPEDRNLRRRRRIVLAVVGTLLRVVVVQVLVGHAHRPLSRAVAADDVAAGHVPHAQTAAVAVFVAAVLLAVPRHRLVPYVRICEQRYR